MIKLKKLLKEHAWDRNFGEPLPTLKDVAEKHQIEEKTKIFMHAMGESKKYKEVKEHAWDRKFGEPLPTLADVMKVKEEKKVTKKHILREMYEKIGGK